jgi:hypothetical protein
MVGGERGQGPATTGSSRSVLIYATKLVNAWLEGPPKKKDPSDCAFMGDKIFAKLFIRYNTAVPSSAAGERFFSQGKDILKAKRARLSPFIRFVIYKMLR